MSDEQNLTVIARRLHLRPFSTHEEKHLPDLVYWMDDNTETGRVDFSAFKGGEISRIGLWIDGGGRNSLAKLAIKVAEWCNANKFMQVQVMLTLEPTGRSFLQVILPDQYEEEEVSKFASHWNDHRLAG